MNRQFSQGVLKAVWGFMKHYLPLPYLLLLPLMSAIATSLLKLLNRLAISIGIIFDYKDVTQITDSEHGGEYP